MAEDGENSVPAGLVLNDPVANASDVTGAGALCFDVMPQASTSLADAIHQTPEDRQLEDLVFGWRRLTDPRLRTLAVRIIQSMAD
jgi:hypothetical protein